MPTRTGDNLDGRLYSINLVKTYSFAPILLTFAAYDFDQTVPKECARFGAGRHDGRPRRCDLRESRRDQSIHQAAVRIEVRMDAVMGLCTRLSSRGPPNDKQYVEQHERNDVGHGFIRTTDRRRVCPRGCSTNQICLFSLSLNVRTSRRLRLQRVISRH